MFPAIASIVFYLTCGIPNTLQSVSYFCSLHMKFSSCLLSIFIKYLVTEVLCKVTSVIPLEYDLIFIRRSEHSSSAQCINLNESLSLKAAINFSFTGVF